MITPSILTPLQQSFLATFFAQPFGMKFFLTGGTALAEYYLRHRYSQDIDLFTLDDESFQEMGFALRRLAQAIDGNLEERITSLTFRQIFVRIPNQPELKIDLVRDVGPQFGEHQHIGGIVVDSMLNIAVNKVTALFGRAADKDFVDLYFLLKGPSSLNELFPLAQEKDPGLNEFYFASMLRRIAQVRTLPQMIKPVTLEELQAFFLPLAERIMLKTKPRE